MDASREIIGAVGFDMADGNRSEAAGSDLSGASLRPMSVVAVALLARILRTRDPQVASRRGIYTYIRAVSVAHLTHRVIAQRHATAKAIPARDTSGSRCACTPCLVALRGTAGKRLVSGW